MHLRHILLMLVLLATMLGACASDRRPPDLAGTDGIVTIGFGAPASTHTIEPPMVVLDPIMGEIEGWTTYQSITGGYILPVPRNWPITDQQGGWIEFQDPNAQAGGDNPAVRGGINMPGRYATTPGGDDLPSGLPDNHKTVLFEQNITTPAGSGKVFTLKRDTPPSQNAIWFEQHAVIPAGKKWLVIWLKIPEPSGGGPIPELAHMLEGFRLR